jgi:hypothetical protein
MVKLVKQILGDQYDPKRRQQGMVYDESVHASPQPTTQTPIANLPSIQPMGQPADPNTRPRVAPNQPINEDLGGVEAVDAPSGLMGDDPYRKAKTDYENAVATPAEKQPLWKQALFMGLQALRQIGTGQTEDYQLLGNAQKNYKVQQAAGRYLPLEHQRQQDQKYKMGEANLDIARQKPAIAQQAVDAKTQNAVTAQRRAEIAERTQTWKESDKAKYWEWEGIKQEAKQKNDDRTYEMAVRKQAEIERHNQVGEQQAATNEQGRNDRQSSGQTFTAGQNALKRQMQSAIKQYDTAVKNHDQAKAEAARERLIKLKAELGQ